MHVEPQLVNDPVGYLGDGCNIAAVTIHED